MTETSLVSFVLRFTSEHSSKTEPVAGLWRGAIRHVQSDEQLRFTQMEDALAFIARYVDITDNNLNESNKPNDK